MCRFLHIVGLHQVDESFHILFVIVQWWLILTVRRGRVDWILSLMNDFVWGRAFYADSHRLIHDRIVTLGALGGGLDILQLDSCVRAVCCTLRNNLFFNLLFITFSCLCINYSMIAISRFWILAGWFFNGNISRGQPTQTFIFA